MKKIAVCLFALSIILIITCGIFATKGFDYKNSYYKSDNYSSLNKNTYVGGDAYNYIINGTYFSGYMTLCSGMGLGAITTLCFGLYFYGKSKDKTFDALKTIYNELSHEICIPEIELEDKTHESV